MTDIGSAGGVTRHRAKWKLQSSNSGLVNCLQIRINILAEIIHLFPIQLWIKQQGTLVSLEKETSVYKIPKNAVGNHSTMFPKKSSQLRNNKKEAVEIHYRLRLEMTWHSKQTGLSFTIMSYLK